MASVEDGNERETLMRASRRGFFGRVSGWLSAVALGGVGAHAAADTTKMQGAPVRAYGVRAAYEKAARWLVPSRYPTSTASFTPLAALHGTVTPSALHFERHHAGVPDIDPAAHRLLVHGLVDRPLAFTVEELRRFPVTQRQYFIECSGNTNTEWAGPRGADVQQTHGLMSCSEWCGVRLAEVLAECGVQPAAAWIVFEGADGAAMTRSLPLAKCLDDVLLAYAQNGEALRPEQGYPLRLIVPGWEGSTHVKWLRRAKVTAEPYYTREETAKYTDLMPDGRARSFSFVMEAKSVITTPSPGSTLVRGEHEIRGLAWSGRGRITRVEVSVDGGASWQTAQLHGPVLPLCHTRFTLPWRWDGEPAVLASRATDETGYVQPTREALTAVRGVRSFYHYNAIQQWRVTASGALENV
jgi:sulfane dehydrogenase subunit SoxC